MKKDNCPAIENTDNSWYSSGKYHNPDDNFKFNYTPTNNKPCRYVISIEKNGKEIKNIILAVGEYLPSVVDMNGDIYLCDYDDCSSSKEDEQFIYITYEYHQTTFMKVS